MIMKMHEAHSGMLWKKDRRLLVLILISTAMIVAGILSITLFSNRISQKIKRCTAETEGYVTKVYIENFDMSPMSTKYIGIICIVMGCLFLVTMLPGILKKKSRSEPEQEE